MIHQRHFKSHSDDSEEEQSNNDDSREHDRIRTLTTLIFNRFCCFRRSQRWLVSLIAFMIFAVCSVVAFSKNPIIEFNHSSPPTSLGSSSNNNYNDRRRIEIRPTFELNANRYFWYRNESFVVRTDINAAEKQTLLFSGSVHYFRLFRF